MWIKNGDTNKSGIDAIREYLIKKGIEYVQLTEEKNNEISAALVDESQKEESILKIITYKIENNIIYMFEE